MGATESEGSTIMAPDCVGATKSFKGIEELNTGGLSCSVHRCLIRDGMYGQLA